MGRSFLLLIAVAGLSAVAYFWFQDNYGGGDAVYEVVEEFVAEGPGPAKPYKNFRAAEAKHLELYIEDEEKYLAKCPPDLDRKTFMQRKCNVRPTAAVPVAIDAAPYQAQIAAPADYPWPEEYRKGKALWELRHYCGGSLIASGWVLTAAHCVDEKMIDEGFGVRLGMGELSNDNAPFFAIDKVVVHPGYKPDDGKTVYVDDIALVHYVADPDAITIQSFYEYGQTYTQGAGAPVLDARVLPGGDRVMTWSGDGTQRVWDIASGKELSRGEGYQVLSYDGEGLFGDDTPSFPAWLKFMYRSGVLQVEDDPVDEQDQPLDPYVEIRAENDSYHRMPDDQGFYPYADDRHALFWSPYAIFVTDMYTLESGPSLAPDEYVMGAQLFADDGLIIAATQINNEDAVGRIHIWDANTFDEYMSIDTPEQIQGVATSQDGDRFLTFGGSVLELSDVATGAVIRRMQSETDRRARSVRGALFYRDGTRAVSWTDAYGGGEIHIWDLETGERLHRIRHSDQYLGDRVEEARVFADDTRLLTRSRYGVLNIWNLDTGERLASVNQHIVPEDIYIFDDGARVLATDTAGAILWDMTTSTEIARFDHNLMAQGADISPDGATLLTWSNDGTARLWDTTTGAELKRFYHSGAVNGGAFVDDGDKVLTWSVDGAARLWDAASGNQLMAFDHKHTPPDAPLFDPAVTPAHDPLLAAYINFAGADFNLPPGAIVDIFGWGKTRDVEGYEPFATLLSVNLTVLDQKACQDIPGYGPEKIHDKVFCASDPVQKTCKGDSGGPVVNQNVLVGVVSWGKKECESDDRPGVYTRVSAYADWIAAETGVAGVSQGFFMEMQ